MKQELIAIVAVYEQDFTSENKPGLDKVSQGNNLLCKVSSVSEKTPGDSFSSAASQCPLADLEWRVMLLGFNPSWQLSPTQPLAHCLPRDGERMGRVKVRT